MPFEQPFVTVEPIAEGEVGRLELAVRRDGPVKRLHVLARPSRPEVLRTFMARAELARTVSHHNVLTLHQIAEDHDGPFAELRYVEGITARDLIESDEPLPVQVAIRIALQVAEALGALGALPGAIAPRFLLIGWDEIVRATGACIGAGDLGYAAPEVLRGARPDARADLFALGVCLHELLVGARLYPREDARSSRRILEEPTPDVALEREDVPIPVVELLFELLAKSPAQRPPSAAIVTRRLSDALGELVAEEDVIGIGAHLAEAWSGERDRRRRRIAEAVVPLERGGL